MTAQRPDEIDTELLQRYRTASEAESTGPSDAVRRAILAEGRRLAALNAGTALPQQRTDSSPSAVRRPGWRFAAVGTLSAAMLAAFLIVPRFLTEPTPLPRVARSATPSASGAVSQSETLKKSVEESTAYAPAVSVPAARSVARLAPDDQPKPAPKLARERSESYAESRQMTADAVAAPAAAPIAAAVPQTLLAAVTSGDLPKIAQFLDQGAPINESDELGRSPLMLATRQGRLDIVQLLLTRGGDPNAADRTGNTPRQEARRRQFTEIETVLERAGAH